MSNIEKLVKKKSARLRPQVFQAVGRGGGGGSTTLKSGGSGSGETG
jgi:hypothetical protein